MCLVFLVLYLKIILNVRQESRVKLVSAVRLSGCGFGCHIKTKLTSTYQIILQLYINWMVQMSLTVKNIKTWQNKDKVNDRLLFLCIQLF